MLHACNSANGGAAGDDASLILAKQLFGIGKYIWLYGEHTLEFIYLGMIRTTCFARNIRRYIRQYLKNARFRCMGQVDELPITRPCSIPLLPARNRDIKRLDYHMDNLERKRNVHNPHFP